MAIGVGWTHIGSGGGGGGASASLAVALSDSTPNFGDSVTITVTPTGITPTSYTFSVPLADGSGHALITQVSNIYVWTAVYYGALNISVTATDGVSEATDTVSVTVTYAFGNAATLNGSQWFTTDDVNGLNDIVAGRTWQFGFWFNPTSLANSPVVFSMVTSGSGFLIQVTSTRFDIYIGGSTTFRRYNQAIATGSRHYILIQKTGLGDSGKVYYNGNPIVHSAGTFADPPVTNSGIYIGRYSGTTFELNGKVKDVVMQQSFLSSDAQALAYYNSGNGSHPSVLGKFPDWWLWLNSNGSDYGRLGKNTTGVNSPTYTAF